MAQNSGLATALFATRNIGRIAKRGDPAMHSPAGGKARK